MMADRSSITDWVTAAATGATAVAVTISSFIAWIAYRRDRKNRLPIVEADFRFEGQYRILDLLIRNRLPETLVITSAQIRKPKGSLISGKFTVGSDGGAQLVPPTSSLTDVTIEIEPFGTTPNAIGGLFILSDSKLVELYLLLPKGWGSGVVVVDLRISSKALTLRDKRIVIKRFTTAPPKINTAPRGIAQISS